jgi:uncharacterized membrane protein
VHLYRGEVSRANVWRQRLDQTTNWAIFVTATALGFAFGNDRGHHLSLMFANLMLYGLLVLEARRFRFFDVWRARVRKIETNFFGPILQRELASPEEDWALKVASDLHTPHFHLTRLQALQLRLKRNYIAIFGIVLLAWLIKLDIHPEPAHSLEVMYERCRLANLPPWVTLAAVGVFYGWLLLVLVLGRSLQRSPMQDNWDIGEIVKEESRNL